MADRYEDFDRNNERERYGDRERGRDAGQRFDEYRRERRGEGDRGRDRDYEFLDRDRSYGREHDQDREREGWRDRSRSAGQRTGGGMSDWYGKDLRGERYSTYSGGMGEGFSRGRESWSRDRDRGDYEDRRGGTSGASSYGAGAYGTVGYGTAWTGEGGEYRGMQGRGRYAGKGPKGYQRSDERIREDVCERLTQHPDVDASEVEIEVNNGEVTLTGSVEDRSQKRIAEDIIEELSGVREVNNRLRISRGIGDRIGDALGLSGRNEDNERRSSETISPTGRQFEPTTTRRR